MNAEVLGATVAKQLAKALEDTENRVDAELERLDNLKDDDLELIRERRRKEMMQRRADALVWKQLGHGVVVESGGEIDFFAHCKKSPKIFCHVRHPTVSVERSEYLTKHMQKMAEAHLDILFLNADAERHPFIVNRLGISVIPTIIFIEEMIMSHASLGFSELNNSDEWNERDLEKLLEKNGMFKHYPPTWHLTRKEIVDVPEED